MNLVMELVKIEKPERVIAFFVSKTKNIIQKGITTPPPPIPAIVHKAMRIGNNTIPINSFGKTGNISLCSHISDYILHFS